MLDAFLHALQSVFILTVLTGVGWVTGWKCWWPDDRTSQFIARLVTYVALPASLSVSVYTDLTADQLLAIAGTLAIPAGSIWTCFAISIVLARVARVRTEHRGTFCAAFTATNNMFVGLAVSLSLYGNQGVVPTLIYFIANITFFWTVGNWLIVRDGMRIHHQDEPPILSLTTVRRIFAPPLVGFLVGMVCVLLALPVPAPVVACAKYLGSMSMPLALVLIGYMLFRECRGMTWDRDLALVMFGRFIVCPCVCWAFASLLPAPDFFKQVFVIQAALPCASNVAVQTRLVEADARFGTQCVCLSTVLTAAALPFWMVLLTAVGQ